MAILKSSKLVTICGLVESFGFALAAVPVAIIIAYAQIIKDGPPHWFNVIVFPTVALGITLKVLGSGVGGWASKGADEVPTKPQVDAATIEAKAEKQVEAAKIDPASGGKP